MKETNLKNSNNLYLKKDKTIKLYRDKSYDDYINNNYKNNNYNNNNNAYNNKKRIIINQKSFTKIPNIPPNTNKIYQPSKTPDNKSNFNHALNNVKSFPNIIVDNIKLIIEM